MWKTMILFYYWMRLIPEIGPHFLARGVAVSGRRIMDLGEAWAAQIDRPEEEVQIALQTPDP